MADSRHWWANRRRWTLTMPDSTEDWCRSINVFRSFCRRCWRRWSAAVMCTPTNPTNYVCQHCHVLGTQTQENMANCCCLAWPAQVPRSANVTVSIERRPFECDRHCCWHLATAATDPTDVRLASWMKMAYCCWWRCESYYYCYCFRWMCCTVWPLVGFRSRNCSDGRWDAVSHQCQRHPFDWCSDSLRRCNRRSRLWICATHSDLLVPPCSVGCAASFADISLSSPVYRLSPVSCDEPAENWSEKKIVCQYGNWFQYFFKILSIL